MPEVYTYDNNRATTLEDFKFRVLPEFQDKAQSTRQYTRVTSNCTSYDKQAQVVTRRLCAKIFVDISSKGNALALKPGSQKRAI